MSNNPSPNNPSDNTHQLNFTGSINGLNNNTFPPTTSPNTNHLNASYNYNNYNDYVPTVNDIFPAHPPVTSDNNIHSHQQSMPNNASTSQFPQQYPQQYSQYIDQNPLQNVFPHSLNITINSPQTNIIYIMSSDMQNQLLQGRTYLNRSPSDIIKDNSQTQVQQ